MPRPRARGRQRRRARARRKRRPKSTQWTINHFVKGKKKGTPAKTAKPDKKAKATAGKQTGKRDAKEHGSSHLQTDPVGNACHVRHRTAATRANMGPTPKKLRQASGLDIDGGIVTTSLSSDDDSGLCVRLGTFFSGMETPSIALTQLGMRNQLMFAVESEPALLSYIKDKYEPLHLCDDVNKVDDASLPAVDLFVGGPPCQSFARGGKVQGLEDARGCLIFKMVESLEKQSALGKPLPRGVVIENSKLILFCFRRRVYQQLKRRLMALGYKVRAAVMNTAEHGLPQAISNQPFL